MIHARILLSAGLLAVAVEPARAQGSAYADMVVKGRRALNDLQYRTADTVWQQLLQLSLTRHQRVDVLQYLTATMYPDERPEQHRDSAVALIRQLVRLGARRMVVRDASWAGLDSLYASVRAASPDVGPTTFDGLSDVVGLMAEYGPDQIASRVTVDCAAFPFAELETAARRARAQATLPDLLRRTCGRLLVETDPPSGVLTVDSVGFGVVPDGGLLRWVRPARNAALAVTLADSRSSTSTPIPEGKLVHVRFALVKDTLPWPEMRSPVQIADELQIYSGFRLSENRPPQPQPPRRSGAFGTGLIWGLIGGAAGFAAAQFLPAVGCTVNKTVPAGETWKVRGQKFTAGQTANLGAGPVCTAGVAGGTGLSLFFITTLTKSAKNGAANRRYNDAVAAYPATLKNWEADQRRVYAEQHPGVKQALTDQQAKVSQTKAQNDSIRARNTNLPAPEVMIKELTAVPAGVKVPPQ